MSLAYGEQGKYSLDEESQAAAVTVPEQISVRFVDVTREAGINTKPWGPVHPSSGFAPGACFLDYDGDGLFDVFLPDSGLGMALYHNVVKGEVEDVSRKTSVDPKGQRVGC